MRIEISLFHNIEDSMFIKIFGIWDQPELNKILGQIQAKNPTYLIVDPTESMFSEHHNEPVEDTSQERREAIHTIVMMLKDNPRMIYLIINKSNSKALKTAIPYYEKFGVADRYLFPKDEAEALDIIRTHQAQS